MPQTKKTWHLIIRDPEDKNMPRFSRFSLIPKKRAKEQIIGAPYLEDRPS